jgi:hypothetical protein
VIRHLDLEALDLVLEGSDLAHQVTCLIRRDRARDNRAGYSTLGQVSMGLGSDHRLWPRVLG